MDRFYVMCVYLTKEGGKSNFFLCLGQARLDGAFCSYTEKDKMEYIAWLKEGGVANIEMESTCFAALTYQAGIRSSIVCVALLDRLNEDQVSRDTINVDLPSMK